VKVPLHCTSGERSCSTLITRKDMPWQRKRLRAPNNKINQLKDR
jgi:hypothetical protein